MTLDGGSGFGVLAQSENWPQMSRAELDEFWTVLQLNVDSLEEAPSRGTSFGWYIVGRFRLLVRKTVIGNDGHGRPGNYVAHALCGFREDITATQVLGLWSGGLPASRLPDGVEPTAHLPQVEIELDDERRNSRGVPLDPPIAESCVAGVLSSARLARGVLLLGSSEQRVADALAHLFSILPQEYLHDLTFSTVEESTELARGLTVYGGLRGSRLDTLVHESVLTVDIDGRRVVSSRLNAQELHCGRLTVAGKPRLSDLVSRIDPSERRPLGLADLANHVDLLDQTSKNPDALSGLEVLLILTSPLAYQWLCSASVQSKRVDVLVRAFSSSPRSVLTLPPPVRSDPILRSDVLRALSLIECLTYELVSDVKNALTLLAPEYGWLRFLAWRRSKDAARVRPRMLSSAASDFLIAARLLDEGTIRSALKHGGLSSAIVSCNVFHGEVAMYVTKFGFPGGREVYRSFLDAVVSKKPRVLADVLLQLLADGVATTAVVGATVGSDNDSRVAEQMVSELLRKSSASVAPLVVEFLRVYQGDGRVMHDILAAAPAQTSKVFGLHEVLARYLLVPSSKRRPVWSRLK